jgi:glucose 1-dehydrogenase
MYPDLAGKVVVITGGSQGIGGAIVRRLSLENMSVVLGFQGDDRQAERTVEALNRSGSRAIAVRADVGTEKGARALLNAAIVEMDGLDVWVNSAGIEKRSPTHKLTLEDWNRVMNINLTGTFLGTRTAIKYFLHQHQKGRVINLTSVFHKHLLPEFAPFAASRGGVGMFSETVALEYAGQGIRVNSIDPGTGLAARPSGLERAAAVAAWLASGESEFVTGANIVIDGGLSGRCSERAAGC